jgi:predicted amidophosphoribosyltransferase
MTCPKCGKEFASGSPVCPHCGKRNDAASGVFQTSTVLISTEGADRVYRSVEEVPARLRNRLLKTTNGANSATILIADRQGRKEIDKAMRKLPGPAQRRLVHSMLSGEQGVNPLAWLTPAVRKWIAAAVFLLAVLVTIAVFLYKSKG